MKQVIVSYELYDRLKELPQTPNTLFDSNQIVPTHLLPVVLEDGQEVHGYEINPNPLCDLNLTLRATNTPIHI